MSHSEESMVIFPLWNSMGGSMVGQTKVMENNINIVNSFLSTR